MRSVGIDEKWNSACAPNRRFATKHATAGVRDALKGCTVVRFAHALETGGGVESYLDDLDRALLERNAMTVIRIFIGTDPKRMEERTETIGRGSLILVPLPLSSETGRQIAPEVEPKGTPWKHRIRNCVLYNPLAWRLYTARYLARRRVPARPGQVVGAGRKISELLRRYRVDLIMLHFFGGADADEIVVEALRANVPYAILNHYSNERFLHLSIRKHAMLASGVAGVSALRLPSYLQGNFCDLSDGVDLDFFSSQSATLPSKPPAKPLFLLPARIIRPKGHLDLVRSGALLRQAGLDFAIAFAGRVDSSRFVNELREEITKSGLKDDTHFLGELSAEELRDWYAASVALVFPTYHHEGLPRVLLEAQAMSLPITVYDSGGSRAGLIPNETGFLVKPGYIESLARGMHRLLAEPSLARTMGQAGRRFVEERFSLPAMATRHENFYLQVIHRRTR